MSSVRSVTEPICHVERHPMQQVQLMLELAKCFTRWATRCENRKRTRNARVARITAMQEKQFMAKQLSHLEQEKHSVAKQLSQLRHEKHSVAKQLSHLEQENRYTTGKLTRAKKRIKGMQQAFTGVARFCKLVSNILARTGKDAAIASTLELCNHVFEIRKDRLQWCFEEWRANQQHEFYQDCLELFMKSEGLREKIGDIFEGDSGASVRLVFPPEFQKIVRYAKANKLSLDDLNVECEWIDGSQGEADTLQD